MEYQCEADDPYKLLAYRIMVDYNLPTVKKILHDNKFVKKHIIREVRSQDFQGDFIDCLFVAIFEDKERMELMQQLNALGGFLYKKLDLPRLRKEIRTAFAEMDMSDLLED